MHWKFIKLHTHAKSIYSSDILLPLGTRPKGMAMALYR